MNKTLQRIERGEFFLIAGPCVIESEQLCRQVARVVSELAAKYDVPYIFKASYKKANRTSAGSYAGPGLESGLKVLQKIKTEFDLPILTDVHETSEVDRVAEVADILQIPAFLCRQTDLVVKAASTGKWINIKKGQFLAPDDMAKIAAKAKTTRIMLTERGASFGYHNLVVDFRSLLIMKQTGHRDRIRCHPLAATSERRRGCLYRPAGVYRTDGACGGSSRDRRTFCRNASQSGRGALRRRGYASARPDAGTAGRGHPYQQGVEVDSPMKRLSRPEFVERLKTIKLLALDVDGVLTDDSIYFGPDGFELKKFNISDGFYMVLAMRSGLEIAIVSGRYSAATESRMKDLGVKHVLQAKQDKVEMIRPVLAELKIGFEQVAFVGNELLDIKLAREIGLPIAVADAAPDLLSEVVYVTERKGGHAAVHEVLAAWFEAVGLNPKDMVA